MAEQIKMMFGLNTHGGPWNIVLDVGADPPHREGKGPCFKFRDLPPIFETAEARDLEFCGHIEGWGP